MASSTLRSFAPYLLVAALTGCGGDDSTSGEVTGTASNATTAPMTTTSTGAAETSEGSSSSGGSSSGGSSSGGSSSTGVAADSTTGDPPLTLDETAVQLQCTDNHPAARILILPGQFDGICGAPPMPPPGVVILTLRDWDGMAGAFEVTADGSSGAQAGLGASLQAATGTVAIEVSAPWAPSFITYDLESMTMTAAGTAELGLCPDEVPADPCAA